MQITNDIRWGVDLFILNNAVTDFRINECQFVDKLVALGGLVKCAAKDMPQYTQQQYKEWIDRGLVTAGGPGNTAPLIAKAGLKVAVGATLGKGSFGGLDAAGRYFCDAMTENNVDMSQTFVHPDLPTAATFIYDRGSDERGGLAYFPNANNDFDFGYFKRSVEKLRPKIVYYMYSGLSDRGDANGGRDLADFMAWCRSKGATTIVDSHTLTGNPRELIDSGTKIEQYKLLEPLLGQLDLFFTSCDEARMIDNTIGDPELLPNMSEDEHIRHFLDFLAGRFCVDDKRTRLFGVTTRDGAYEKHTLPDGGVSVSVKVGSDFMAGEVIDLVGAGDAFRAGLLCHIAANIDAFRDGSIDFIEAVRMGNLFASVYIKSPLEDRYSNIGEYDRMLKVVGDGITYDSFADLIAAIKR